jgi:hypothetical protein
MQRVISEVPNLLIATRKLVAITVQVVLRVYKLSQINNIIFPRANATMQVTLSSWKIMEVIIKYIPIN